MCLEWLYSVKVKENHEETNYRPNTPQIPSNGEVEKHVYKACHESIVKKPSFISAKIITVSTVQIRRNVK